MLRNAVNPTTSRKYRSGIDRHDLPPRIDRRENLHRLSVAWIVERAGDHRAVHRQMVDVAVIDESLAIRENVRSGQLHDPPRISVSIGSGVELRANLATDLVIGMLGISLGVN